LTSCRERRITLCVVFAHRRNDNDDEEKTIVLLTPPDLGQRIQGVVDVAFV
jgi:hypothetical protein